MKRIFLILYLLLSSCAQAKQDQEFAVYIAMFDMTYKVDSRAITIEFVDALQSANQMGICWIGQGHIQISRYYWKRITNTTKNNLIFHELGHCLFNRIHLEEEFADGCPISIMSANIVSDDCFNKHMIDMINELRPG